VLLFVAWNMGEWREFGRLRHYSNHYRLMLLSTFFVTVIFDLTVAVELGLVLAVVLFVVRQGDIFTATETRRTDTELHFRLYGSLFFGAVGKIDPLVAAAQAAPGGTWVVLDMGMLVSMDTTGQDALEQLLKAVEKRGGSLRLVGVQPQPLSLMQRSGFAQRVHLAA
jgi:SulP family sulfate permease